MFAPDGEQKWPSHITQILVKRILGIQFATELQMDGASIESFLLIFPFWTQMGEATF